MEFFISTNEELSSKERKISDVDSDDGINNTKSIYSSTNAFAASATATASAEPKTEYKNENENENVTSSDSHGDKIELEKDIVKDQNQEKADINDELKEKNDNKNEN
jgi:hypothetical protein